MPHHQFKAALPIATVTLGEAGCGRIGIAPCPGRHGEGLDGDLDAIVAWGAFAVLSLIGLDEMARLGVAHLGKQIDGRGLVWHHLPIDDFGVPDERFEVEWRQAGPTLHDHLTQGQSIVVHCRAGLGRSGLIAARLLIERGMAPHDAVRHVRQARPGAIETAGQEAHLRAVADRR